MKKNIFIWLGIIVIVFGGAYFAYSKIKDKKSTDAKNNVSSYDECIAQNNLIQESYPAICRTPDGKSFTQDIGNELEKTDLIIIENPRPNTTISSPLTISGQARGSWFFEASFPIKLYDGNNNLIASGIEEAQSNWMTDEFVSFRAELKFNVPATQKGTLILEKDNPSDLPKNNDQLIVPILFR